MVHLMVGTDRLVAGIDRPVETDRPAVARTDRPAADADLWVETDRQVVVRTDRMVAADTDRPAAGAVLE